MDYLSKLSDIDLDAIGLERENNEVNIKIPDEANIYKMTLGRYLNTEDINKLLKNIYDRLFILSIGIIVFDKLVYYFV